MKTLFSITALLLFSLLLSGCSGWLNALVPDVYLVDRHTITEADAAGDWPALEQRLRETIHSGPRPLAGMDDNLDQSDSFQVLNDELSRHPISR
jgi:hypothetical protein